MDHLRSKHPEPTHSDLIRSVSAQYYGRGLTLYRITGPLTRAHSEFLDKWFSIPKINQYFRTRSRAKVILKSTGMWKQAFRIGRELETGERQVGRGVGADRMDTITRSDSTEDEVWLRLRYEGGVGGHDSEGLRVKGRGKGGG